ncbi:MAG: CoA pyrophosphatase [Rhodobacteraceae bacterium]|nr:CoA pyrophosphatase [Alphaproteobacteria bacterium]NNK65917.1 CoA pyrophosphatase [Paracoccaceae bacterium]
MTETDARTRLKAALERSGAVSSDFDLNPGVTLPPGRKLRAAGVLIALREQEGETQVILTKRSSALKHHPGQIAFPGGKVDADDRDAIAAALREAEEEIGLPRDIVEVMGALPTHETVTGFRVTPVLGWIRQEFDLRPEAGEVDEAFCVPLSHVTDLAQFSIQSRRWRGQRRHYYTVPWGPYYIWGATARMLRALAERVTA